MFIVKVLVVLLSFVGFVKPGSVIFNDCGSLFELEDVAIEGCNTHSQCLLYNGTHPKVSMKLSTKSVSETFNQRVNLVLRGVQILLDVSPEDLCTQIICPTQHNHKTTYVATVNLERDDLVELDGYLYWIITDQKDDIVICMETDVKLKI